jgi:predicted nucleotidyltransferase
MSSRIASVLNELRPGLQALYGPRLVSIILFGSQARGDMEAGSDIDVLIVLKGPVQAGTEIARVGPLQAELSLRHNCVIACVFMDEDRYLRRDGPLLRNIRREGVFL